MIGGGGVRRCQWDGPWIALQRRLPNVPGLFPAFAETLLVSSQPLQTGGLHWGTCWVDGRPVSERTGLERGAAEAGPLAPRPGPRSGGNEPIAVLPDFVSLPVSGTLGFPPFNGQLHSWHDGVKSTCTLQPMAMRSAFAASPDWRTHSGREESGRRLRLGMRLKGCGSGGCTQITCAMSSADGPDPAEAPEERCFLRSARERDRREAAARLEEGLGDQGLRWEAEAWPG